MTLDAGLGAFAQLATAIGLVVSPTGSATVEFNPTWFDDPVGTTSNHNGLRNLLDDDGQRDALLAFVDAMLGAPDRMEYAGATWVPVFREDTYSHVTIHAVIATTATEIHLGIGVDHSMTGPAPRVSSRLHVPIFRFARRDAQGHATALTGTEPTWLLLGRPGAHITTGVDVTISDTPAPAGEAWLGGVSIALGVPTGAGDDLSVALELRDLQLPGAAAPQSFGLDASSLAELGPDAYQLLVGLLQAQADAISPNDPDLAPFARIAGLLGLREVSPELPRLPLAELPTGGLPALVGWVESVLSVPARRNLWLGELVGLLQLAIPGVHLDPARSAVVVPIGTGAQLEAVIGLRVEPGAGGHPVLTVIAEIGAAPRPDVRLRLAAEVVRVDTGTGQAVALPDLRLEAVFGADPGGLALLDTAAARIGSVHLGLGLDADRRPKFLLTLHDVAINQGEPHPILDLSSPQAALDAASTVITEAVADAIALLGAPGNLLNSLLGLQPPAPITAIAVPELIADPLAAMLRYWRDLTAPGPAGLAVLGSLATLLGGTANGSGTAAYPWRLTLLTGLDLVVWRDDDLLLLDLAGSVTTPVLGDYEASAEVAVRLARVDLVTGACTFASRVGGRLALARADGEPAQLHVGQLSLHASAIAGEISWAPVIGVRGRLDAPGLALGFDDLRGVTVRSIPIALPEFDDHGRLVIPAADWDAVEVVVAALVRELGLPVVDLLIELVGWGTDRVRLSLADLVGADPAGAARAWLSTVALNGGWARFLVGGLDRLFGIGGAAGEGSRHDPWRLSTSDDPRAPGLAVWLGPDWRPEPLALTGELSRLEADRHPRAGEVADALSAAAEVVPRIAELLALRDPGAGLTALVGAWAGTDGAVAPPATAPTGVTMTTVDGFGYAELVTLGRTGLLLPRVSTVPPTAVVHVGCDPDIPASTAIPATGDGVWFVSLPAGGVAEHAAALASALAARTAPVTLVAYGAGGAPAIRAAATVTAVTAVVTVGTPWSPGPAPVPPAALDAARLLECLTPEGVGDIAGGRLYRLAGLVARTLALAHSGAVASAATETLRPGLVVTAVFGSLAGPSLWAPLADLVANGVSGLAAQNADSGWTWEDDAATELHYGLRLPGCELGAAGLRVTASATVEFGRWPGGSGRSVSVDLRIGATDGWLVGGPTADSALRWLAARVEIPLSGGAGSAELTLHEARSLGVSRPRWVVGADAATVATPEARALLSAVVDRLVTGAPAVASLLGNLGLITDSGLDPDGLDRLLHDTGATLRAAVTYQPAVIAAGLRGLDPAITGAGNQAQWTVGDTHITVDLGTGVVEAALHLTVPPLDVVVHSGPAEVVADLTLGVLDPSAGGLRLVGHTAPAGRLAVEWAPPGSPTRTVTLLPQPDTAGLTDLAAVAVPALVTAGLAGSLRWLVSGPARAALDAALIALGVLTADGRIVAPIGLVANPGGWLRHAAAADWRSAAMSLLDAVAPLVTPIAPGVTLIYQEVGTDGLRLGLAAQVGTTLDTVAVDAHLGAGLVISATHPPAPFVTVTGSVAGRGLTLAVDPSSAPPVALGLVLPTGALPLFPTGPGLGQALSTVGGSLLPVALNALAAQAAPAGALAGAPVAAQVGRVVQDLGAALDLLENGQFTGDRLQGLAASPVTVLLDHLPQLVVGVTTSLATALDPQGTFVQVPAAGTLRFGSTNPLQITMDAAAVAVGLSASVEIPYVGRLRVESLRLDATGLAVSATLGPADLNVGPFALRPMLSARLGNQADRHIGVGLALDAAGTQAVQVRWNISGGTVGVAAVQRDANGAETLGTDADAITWMLGLGLAAAGGIAVAALPNLLAPTATPTRVLRGVVLEDTPTAVRLDPALVAAIFDPPQLLRRMMRLLWNAADAGLKLTIEEKLEIRLALLHTNRANGVPVARLGIGVSLAPGQTLSFGGEDSETIVELEVDNTWVRPEVDPGLSVYVLESSSGDVDSFDIGVAVSVSGVGLRFRKESGPLLELGPIALGGIAVQVYGEVAGDGALGGGVNLELAALAFAPTGGGSNAMANSMVADTKSASPASRPAFSPAIAVQKHPGHDLSFTVRAGRPPGPWWLTIQRQLGPIYLERVGFNSKEDPQSGTVTEVSVLLDATVSLYGMSAGVDQLSLTWHGGDVFDLSRWSVDLMGLAVGASMSGVTIVGGILKTIDIADDGHEIISYVGMLIGKFPPYGLSLFGGFTNDRGNASFFIFGGVNGSLGGPPYFFLTGVGGGLGINRGLKIPEDPSTFNTFPFITALDPAAKAPAKPMDALRALNEYFPHRMGNYWFAAGISFTCFSLIDGVAVVAVAFGDGFEFSLLGLARVALPRPQAAIVSIELGLLVRFSTKDGVFLIRAGLTPNSYLLYQDVHLTGGFAFVFWWKGKLAGQFVVTMGGYHPSFHRDGYPEVQRLGLNWQYGEYIVIKGGIYFALTSEALMAGMQVEAAADFGFAYARVAFAVDALLLFDPLHYEATAYARIAAGVDLGPLSFSFAIAAEIKVWGPEFTGEASVTIGPSNYKVAFGSQRKDFGELLGWPAFLAKYLEDGGSGTARVLSSIAGHGALPASTGGNRDAPSSDGSQDRPYEVQCEFELTVISTVPFAQVDAGLATGAVPVPVKRSDDVTVKLGIGPMGQVGLSSVLRLRLERLDAQGTYTALANELREIANPLATPPADTRPEERFSRVTRDSFPIGVWGEPDLNRATPALPKGDVVTAGSQVQLVVAGAKGQGRVAFDLARVEAMPRRALPFATAPVQLVAASVGAALGAAPLPAGATTADALAAAQQLVAAGRSGVAGATFRGDRSAPPIFASPTGPVPSLPSTPPGRPGRPGHPVSIVDRPVSRATWLTVVRPGVGPAPAPRPIRPREPGADSRTLASGDILAIRTPAGPARTGLAITGSARVVMLAGDGSVLFDGDPGPRVAVPAATALTVVHADGRLLPIAGAQTGPAPARYSGLAGWHLHSTVAGIGPRIGLAAGCVLTRGTGRAPAGRQPDGVHWTTATDLLRGTAWTRTQFAVPAPVVAVLVETTVDSQAPAVDLGRQPLQPSASAYGRGIAAYAFAGSADRGLAVRVVPRAGQRIVAVLGGTAEPTDVALALVTYGAAAVAAPMPAGTGAGCAVTWVDHLEER